ncbi:hypothetical protein PM082_009010 [Marasmius tenuissimus]|nr:hypothetical protein PM082_009010 [Marasmius tenuissimus]
MLIHIDGHLAGGSVSQYTTTILSDEKDDGVQRPDCDRRVDQDTIWSNGFWQSSELPPESTGPAQTYYLHAARGSLSRFNEDPTEVQGLWRAQRSGDLTVADDLAPYVDDSSSSEYRDSSDKACSTNRSTAAPWSDSESQASSPSFPPESSGSNASVLSPVQPFRTNLPGFYEMFPNLRSMD